ncbi:c-type cytochrome [Devosia sp. WQ 349K1]|uniref:c-type cytochrome n=1 Tax=Devosia sp. WQ 349K1 TaxID=2800329 RepID=UPI00349F6C41
MRGLGFGFALSVTIVAGSVAQDAVAQVTTATPVFTQAQADAAKSNYARTCVSCHGDKLQGSGNAPPLSGLAFTSYWNGKPMSGLMEALQRMPADSPGSMTEKQNAELLALILETNKAPAGDAELPSDMAALEAIIFEAPAE